MLRVVLSDPAEWIDQRTDRAAVGYQMYLDAGTGGTLRALFCGVSEVYSFGCYSFENNQATPLAERTVDIPLEPGEYVVQLQATVTCFRMGAGCSVTGAGRAVSATFIPEET